MLAEVIDYRISRIVVLCKDCGQDVGLYPARHKCGIPSSQYLSAGNSTSSHNNSNDHSSKVATDNSQNSKLWNKFLNATNLNNNADYDSDNESEKDEWDGETHISRILREYYENKGADLPDWLYDLDSIPKTNLHDITNKNNNRSNRSNNNVSRGHSELVTSSMNYPSSRMNESASPQNYKIPMNSGRYNNISVSPRERKPPIVRSKSDHAKRLISKESQQLQNNPSLNRSNTNSSRLYQHQQRNPGRNNFF